MSQSISVLIAGHQGKMGTFAQKILNESSDLPGPRCIKYLYDVESC